MNFVKFLGVGGTATLLQYAVLILMVEFEFAEPVVASTFGYALSSICNYLLNYYFTFGSNAHHHLAALKFTVVAITGLCINSGLVYLLTEVLDLHYLFAQVLSTATVLLWNFFIHNHWTYKSTPGN